MSRTRTTFGSRKYTSGKTVMGVSPFEESYFVVVTFSMNS